MVPLKIAVGVPPSAAPIPVVDLHEPDPAFDQSPRRQAEAGEGARDRGVEAVEFLRGLCLGFKPDHFGDRSLHAKRQFVRLHAGSQRGVFALGKGRLVQPPQQFELGSLLGRRNLGGRFAVREGVRRIDLELNPGMGGAEIAGRVGSASTAADIGSVAQHHERREVVIQRPQSPVHP